MLFLPTGLARLDDIKYTGWGSGLGCYSSYLSIPVGLECCTCIFLLCALFGNCAHHDTQISNVLNYSQLQAALGVTMMPLGNGPSFFRGRQIVGW